MTIRQRKLDHLKFVAEDPFVDRQKAWFDRYQLIHQALPEIDFHDIDISCSFLGKQLKAPLLISSMTGGDHPEIIQINQRLAQAAEICGVALSVGSQRIQFEHKTAEESFQLRSFAPTTPLIANLGAVQFNYGFNEIHAQKAIDTLNADALFLHLNPLQEAIQPEGNTKFSGLWSKIEQLTHQIAQPILLKEVGSGLSPNLVEKGIKIGIQGFDIAGTGGTSWSRIEHHRQSKNYSGLIFQDWGLPTPWVLNACRPFAHQTQLIASGGLRNGIDVVKSVVMGAQIAGMAAPFLKPAMESTEAVIETIEQIKHDIRIALFLLGKSKISDIWLQDQLMMEMPK